MATKDERRVYTVAGRIYFVAANTIAALATAWLMTDPFDWVPPMDYFSAQGALFLLALALGLAIAFGSIVLLFTLLALALDKLGARLTRPPA
jgi:hypothetical protein